MFKIISKKEYENLKAVNMARFQELFDVADAEVKRLQEENKELKKDNDFLGNEVDALSHSLYVRRADELKYELEAEKYKKLYYDEFQKRLELAEIVKRMEDAE